MTEKRLFSYSANFVAVIFLLTLVAAPIYFASNFANIQGVKSEANYLVISQIDKFPNLNFSQNKNAYSISFEKVATSEAFLEILLINNPTAKSQEYYVTTSTQGSKVFFGKDLNNQQTHITIPASASVPISLISQGNQGGQTVDFHFTAGIE